MLPGDDNPALVPVSRRRYEELLLFEGDAQRACMVCCTLDCIEEDDKPLLYAVEMMMSYLAI